MADAFDSTATGFVVTPNGLIIRIDEADLPKPVKDYARDGLTETAAKSLATLTGLRSTIQIMTKASTDGVTANVK